MGARAENLEDSFHRNQRLEAGTDDDVPPALRPRAGLGDDPTESSSEEVSSRLTIEEYLMSNLRLPVSTGLDQYATSSFIRTAAPERRRALEQNLAREKVRRRQAPPTGRLKKPAPTERARKRMTRNRPWAEPPKRARPRSAPASRPMDVTADRAVTHRTTGHSSRTRTAHTAAHGRPAAVHGRRAAASASVPRSRPSSAKAAGQSAPAITIQLKTARNKLRVQAGQINRLQKETSKKDRVISELKGQVRTPGRAARLANKREAGRATERKAARDTISKLKGDLKEARKRALRAEAALAASQRELKRAKEKRVSSAKQLRESLAAETAKRQRAEDELKAARQDISKLTRHLRAEERRCSSLKAELTAERERRTALLELSKKHGLDVKRRSSSSQRPQPHQPHNQHQKTDQERPRSENQGNTPRTPGASLLSELRDRRLASGTDDGRHSAGKPDGAGRGGRGTAPVRDDRAPEVATAAAHVVEARGRAIARQQQEELRLREQTRRETQGREQSLRWAAARSAVEDPSLAGGLGGNMSVETAATVAGQRLRAEEEGGGEESFTPLVVKQTEMQKLVTRLRDQAVRKQQHLSQTSSTGLSADDSNAGVTTARPSTAPAADFSTASSGLNISAGLTASRRPLSSYRPLELVGEPGIGSSGSSSSSDFAYVIPSHEQAKSKARLAGIKAATVRCTSHQPRVYRLQLCHATSVDIGMS